MALSNLYVPASARRPGCVGVPLPNVEAAIAEDGAGLTGDQLPLCCGPLARWLLLVWLPGTGC